MNYSAPLPEVPHGKAEEQEEAEQEAAEEGAAAQGPAAKAERHSELGGGMCGFLPPCVRSTRGVDRLGGRMVGS